MRHREGVSLWDRYDGERYFFHDLVWGTDLTFDRSACDVSLYGTCNCLWCSQRMCAGVGGFTAHAFYRDFLKHPESAAGHFIAGSLRKSQHFQYFIYYRDHKLANIAKVVRTEVKQIRNSGYVIAARCMGGSFWHVCGNT